MSDQAQPTEPTQAPSPEPAAPAAPPASSPGLPITVEQLQAMIAAEARKAYDAGAAAARKAEQARTKAPAQPAPKQEATTTAPTVDDPDWGERLSDAINEFPFDKDQRRAIRDAARSGRPEDVDAFVEKWAKMFGKAPNGAPAPAQTQPADAAAQSAPAQKQPTPPTPAPSAPAPAAPAIDAGRPPLFRELSEAAREDVWRAYVKGKGGNPSDLHHPKTRAALRELRTAFEAEASTATVMLGRQR